MAREMARGFSVDWLTDFTFNNPGSFDRYATGDCLLGLRLDGAELDPGRRVADALSRAPDLKYSLADFLRDTGRYAWRLLSLLIIGLICYWIVFSS